MSPRGFTLVELLVVLAILASLTTIAVRSLAGAQERARFEATQRTLQEIELALLGERPGSSRGLLADTCRLPASAVGQLDLFELWSRPNGMASSHIAAASDPEVVLAVGWAGPYVALPPGVGQLLDGWSRPLQIVGDAGSWAVRSLGADDQPGGSGFDQDLWLRLRDDSQGVDRVHAELAGTVTVTGPLQAGNDHVTVVLFEADPVTGEVHPRWMDAPTQTPVVTTTPATVAFAFTRAGGPSGVDNRSFAGRRAVRAYVHPASAASTPWQAGVDASRATTIDLRAGAQTLALTVP